MLIHPGIQPRRCDTILSGHVTRWYYPRDAQTATRMIHATKTWATRPNAQLNFSFFCFALFPGQVARPLLRH